MRVVMGKLSGEVQCVAYDFRECFQSGILRMDWENDGALFIGETEGGWGSAGNLIPSLCWFLR